MKGSGSSPGAGDLGDFGRLLHEAWQIKRGLGDRVTSPALDEVYGKALAAGALGGKLLGAGGTGFMLFYVSPRTPVRRAEGPADVRARRFPVREPGQRLDPRRAGTASPGRLLRPAHLTTKGRSCFPRKF